jgi:hypothetical protein
MKEGIGNDNLAIAWEYPGKAFEVIPAKFSRIINRTQMYTTPITNMALSGGSIQQYFVEVFAGRTVSCLTNGPNGNTDLYLRFGSEAVPDPAFTGNACSSTSETSMESPPSPHREQLSFMLPCMRILLLAASPFSAPSRLLLAVLRRHVPLQHVPLHHVPLRRQERQSPPHASPQPASQPHASLLKCQQMNQLRNFPPRTCQPRNFPPQTTDSPTTNSPTTESPTTESPTTESPTTAQPTSKPTTRNPSTRKPTTRKPDEDQLFGSTKSGKGGLEGSSG